MGDVVATGVGGLVGRRRRAGERLNEYFLSKIANIYFVLQSIEQPTDSFLQFQTK